MRGQGSIYKQRGSNNWHISFYAGGKHFRMSAKTTKKTEARKFLEKKKAEHERHGQLLRDDKVTLRELLDGVVTDYKMNRRKSLRQLKARIKNLVRHFDPATKASQITKSALKRYQAARLGDEAAAATVKAGAINHSDPEGIAAAVRLDFGAFRIAYGYRRSWNLSADSATVAAGDESHDFGVRYKAGKNNFSLVPAQTDWRRRQQLT